MCVCVCVSGRGTGDKNVGSLTDTPAWIKGAQSFFVRIFSLIHVTMNLCPVLELFMTFT